MDLGVHALLAQKREKNGGEDQDKVERDRYTPMSLDILKEYRFNLGGCLGTMIWRKRKFDFNSLDGIKYAYIQVFGATYEDGKRKANNPKVKDWFFDKEYDQLATLEAIRHVLVHRGGRADEQFVGRVKSKNTEFSHLQLGDAVTLDGDIVKRYANVAIGRSCKLIQEVDKWLN
jgi:hypothetical protein